MCRRTALLGAVITAVGAGFVLSSIFQSIGLKILIGAALLVLGFFIWHRN